MTVKKVSIKKSNERKKFQTRKFYREMTMPVAYLDLREAGGDEFVWSFYEEAFFDLIYKLRGSQEWPEIFKSKADVQAFLEDVGRYWALNWRAIVFYNDCGVVDGDEINRQISDELEREADEYFNRLEVQIERSASMEKRS